MITYVQGDLLGATQKVIVHGTNNRGVMGSGVARQIRARWPNVYEVYALKHKVFGLDLGDVIPVATLDGKVIVNAVTQDGFGRDGQRYVDYAAIERCFEIINDKVHAWEVTEVAFPFIGAGLGGGDWKIIEEILTRTATFYTPVVYDFQVDP
jgi:O-acetyl-ADP-ribose deacetylase (regulator of RNase III)